MPQASKQDILEVLLFSSVHFPMKYLDVPLISKRLGASDCKALLDKVRKKVDHWRNKFLSYTGKLLLIASVLEAIQIYWCNVFLLPKTVVKEINKILKNFLWNNEEVSRRNAKVAWKKICKPKIYGGLSLKDITVWNKALLVKHLWNIAIKKDSLWVKWISTVKLKNMSIWVVQKESSDSWGWKILLDIRDIVV
ncbi:hypothetical protein Tco_0327478 [Tanacetum coccineum]